MFCIRYSRLFLIYLKKHETVAHNPVKMVYINKMVNTITFKTKIGYHLELLTPETGKLRSSTKSKITKVKIGKNLPHLEITEVIFVHCNIFDND